MHFSAYRFADVVNGEGCRITIFVSGCSHGCRGCYNQATWRPDFGEEWTSSHLEQLLRDLDNKYITGISLSGGDPLYEGNLEEIEHIIKSVKQSYPDKDIWMWTGYTMKEIEVNERLREVVSKVDVLIDGRFERDKRDPTLKWRGSSNQIIHHIQKD